MNDTLEPVLSLGTIEVDMSWKRKGTYVIERLPDDDVQAGDIVKHKNAPVGIVTEVRPTEIVVEMHFRVKKHSINRKIISSKEY